MAAAKPVPVTISAPASIDIPVKDKRGGKSVYNFDSLTEAGMSFGVTGRDAKSVRSAVSAHNRKFKTMLKNEDGQVVMDGEKPKTTYTKHFEVIEVDADIAKAVKGSSLEGATVIVRRDI
jgi:hypothetical protein